MSWEPRERRNWNTSSCRSSSRSFGSTESCACKMSMWAGEQSPAPSTFHTSTCARREAWTWTRARPICYSCSTWAARFLFGSGPHAVPFRPRRACDRTAGNLTPQRALPQSNRAPRRPNRTAHRTRDTRTSASGSRTGSDKWTLGRIAHIL
jgi:hypothetical protein